MIRLAAPDPRWPSLFATERDRLLAILPGRFTAIEHIGSTAVPHLAAKPIIDLIGGVPSLQEADALLEPLCANGYETSAEFNATLPDARWLMRHAGGRRTHHLHLVVFGGEKWLSRLRFRDALRADAETAGRYLQLKRDLAEQYPHDREAYTKAKGAFIDQTLRSLPNQAMQPAAGRRTAKTFMTQILFA
jgi:GrpB-like predicted nucleotidyltransferase (UPF0157 family)